MSDNKLSILNNFFTKKTFHQCLQNKINNEYTEVICRYIDSPENKKNADLVSKIYNVLKCNYRNEYFYKNTLLNKLLLGVHSINTTVALTELPIAKSKADFVLINGKAVVYEIKTELDNLDRLEGQINDYYKVFDHVAVVTYEKNVSQLQVLIENLKKPVGIYVLKRNGALSELKKPEPYRLSLNGFDIFKVLRKYEYEEILMNYYHELPMVSEFQYYSKCRSLFLEIPIEESYKLVLSLLKKRTKILKEEFVKVPYELRFLAYFMNFKKRDHENMERFLQKIYGSV